MHLTRFEWSMFLVLAFAAVVIVNVGKEPAPKSDQWLRGGPNSYEGVIVIHAERG